MKLKKTTMGCALVALAAMVLTGCGTGANESDTVSPAAVEQSVEEGKATDTLVNAFQNDFTVGVAINYGAMIDTERMKTVNANFNSFTLENEMKPENLLDGPKTESSKDGMPEINTERLEQILKTAKENDYKLRGHCLVWHSQTPDWFFAKDYEPSKGLVGKAEMKKRMETYIKKVLTFCQDNYPGVVYAWDVVNEAMGDDNEYRTESGWYETYGDESYIMDAFAFARKYADEDVKLFYNDYNEYTPAKRNMIVALLKKLKEEGLVDGMGMQSHWDMEYPSSDMVADALEAYGAIEGLEIQLTEIDMHNPDNSEAGLELQAERYKEFLEVILKADRTEVAHITNVTFWGLKDNETWLSGFKGETSYPLLFDEDFQKKPCFDSIIAAAKEVY